MRSVIYCNAAVISDPIAASGKVTTEMTVKTLRVLLSLFPEIQSGNIMKNLYLDWGLFVERTIFYSILICSYLLSSSGNKYFCVYYVINATNECSTSPSFLKSLKCFKISLKDPFFLRGGIKVKKMQYVLLDSMSQARWCHYKRLPAP